MLRKLTLFLLFFLFILGFNETEAYAQSIVDTTVSKYTYNEMLKDINQFRAKYPDKIKVETIGQSVLKRNILLLVVGNPKAEKKILIHGSMHAREYMTTQLIMKQIEYYLQNYSKGKFWGQPFENILDKVAIYYVPMVNPDGVILSQQGLSGIKDSKLRARLTKMNKGFKNFTRWKANINGVDLNRNYNLDWKNNASTKRPGALDYKGPAPESEPETKALVNLLRREKFDATISYHATGSIIYWNSLQKGKHLERDRLLAKSMLHLTGYRGMPRHKDDPGSCFKDWYIQNFGGPAYTIEIGRKPTPLAAKEFPDIWKRNKLTGMFLAYQVGWKIKDLAAAKK